MTLRAQNGFTLVEIIIVIGIIITLAALSITSLIRSKITASESAAMETLKTLQASFEYYRLVNTDYPATFTDLYNANPPYLDSSWVGGTSTTSPTIKGYSYEIELSGNDNYIIVAHPTAFELASLNAREFYMTELGEVLDTSTRSVVTGPIGGPRFRIGGGGVTQDYEGSPLVSEEPAGSEQEEVEESGEESSGQESEEESELGEAPVGISAEISETEQEPPAPLEVEGETGSEQEPPPQGEQTPPAGSSERK